jgi:hypothetical protein
MLSSMPKRLLIKIAHSRRVPDPLQGRSRRAIEQRLFKIAHTENDLDVLIVFRLGTFDKAAPRFDVSWRVAGCCYADSLAAPDTSRRQDRVSEDI